MAPKWLSKNSGAAPKRNLRNRLRAKRLPWRPFGDLLAQLAPFWLHFCSLGLPFDAFWHLFTSLLRHVLQNFSLLVCLSFCKTKYNKKTQIPKKSRRRQTQETKPPTNADPLSALCKTQATAPERRLTKTGPAVLAPLGAFGSAGPVPRGKRRVRPNSQFCRLQKPLPHPALPADPPQKTGADTHLQTLAPPISNF